MKQRENILPAFGFMFFMTGMIMQLFEDIKKRSKKDGKKK
jgi:hypothetical protein